MYTINLFSIAMCVLDLIFLIDNYNNTIRKALIVMIFISEIGKFILPYFVKEIQNSI